MRLDEYAKSGKYLKWTDTDQHDIILAIPYSQFEALDDVSSGTYDTEQYEVPIYVVDGIEEGHEPFESILATKSKNLLVHLLNGWKIHHSHILRLKKQGSGFHTKWTVQESGKYYATATAKVTKTPPKKK